MLTGKVKWFNLEKGYGFIVPDDNSKDVFLHISSLAKSGIKTVEEGQKIGYEIVNERGRESATNIVLV